MIQLKQMQEMIKELNELSMIRPLTKYERAFYNLLCSEMLERGRNQNEN